MEGMGRAVQSDMGAGGRARGKHVAAPALGALPSESSPFSLSPARRPSIRPSVHQPRGHVPRSPGLGAATT